MASSSEDTRSPKTRPTILVVDDSDDTCALYEEYFSFLGYSVIVSSDGADALSKAVVAVPNIIVMDLALPRMPGWDVIRRLKGDPTTRHIPVLVLTGLGRNSDKTLAMAAGASGFLLKPCLPEDLAQKVLIKRDW